MRFSTQIANLSPLLAAEMRAPQKVERLHRDIIVSASLSETFAFFADAANLQRITPPWLHFSILTPMPVQMRMGIEIAYRISLYGLPIPWRSRIDVWQPGVCFVDRQIVGPYRWWRHEHRFEAVPDGTRVIDHVDYAPHVGWLTGALVRRDLGRIFDYRHEALRRIFSGRALWQTARLSGVLDRVVAARDQRRRRSTYRPDGAVYPRDRRMSTVSRPSVAATSRLIGGISGPRVD